MVEHIERETIRTVARRLLPLVFLLYLLSLIDRVNLGFAALTMNNELGLTLYTYSLGVAAFFFAYIPCEVPSNLNFGANWCSALDRPHCHYLGNRCERHGVSFGRA